MRPSSSLDESRRRLMYRAWHCGTLESDLLLGRFLDTHITDLTSDELDILERLMDSDSDILGLVTGRDSCDPQFTDIITRLQKFYLSSSHD